MDCSLRVGFGIDVHRLSAGRDLIIGGVKIAHEKGLDGHSDADVLLHAITDAILGAAGRGDIGEWFPNTDERWRGAESTKLLNHVWQVLSAEGWQLINIDSTLVAQAPKLSPHTSQMKQNIAATLGITADRIGIKATTSEELGYEGRKEGITAYATVLLNKGVSSS
jgi:2-C-methyl-D-erythritol 2,4-cyclodiphosphate synthase